MKSLMSTEKIERKIDIIDAHVHLFPDKLFRAIWLWFEKHGWKVRYRVDGDEVVRLLKTLGVSRFVLLNYSHKPGMSASLNAWTHEFVKKHPEAIPFGAIHPEDENVGGELDRCFGEYGFKGLKFHTHVTGIRPDDERLFPVYEKLIEHNKVLMLHSGMGPSLAGYRETTQEVSGVRFTEKALRRFPQMKVIVPHLGADEIDAFFDLLEEYPNLTLDTTMALSGYFPLKIPWDRMEKWSHRILYGSDFPNIPYDLATEINVLRSSGLSRGAQERILGLNAERLLGISAPNNQPAT